MVVDASALLAILLREPESEAFEQAILRDSASSISSISRLEVAMVLEGRKGRPRPELEEVVETLELEIVAFDHHQLELAIDAFRRYGKGRHPAGLNLGDCCSYGLAKALDQPLLFKGNDFGLTDVTPALEQ